MRNSRIILMICIVVVCAWPAVAQAQSAADARAAATISSLEPIVAAGTATRAQQLELARAYADVGRYYESKKLAQALLGRDANDSDAIAVRDRAVQQLDLIARQRVEDAEAAARREGATAADREELANAYFAAGRLPEAMKIYRGLSPETYSEKTAIALANAHAWSGHRVRAVQVLSDFTARNPNAQDARALLDEMQSSSELRIERLSDQIDADEYNLALRVARARLYSDAGQYGRALKEVRFVREHANGRELPNDLAGIEKNALDRQRDEIAKLDERWRALQAPPMTSGSAESQMRAQQMLDLAKGYTGLGANDRAIVVYDAYLDEVPADTQARLNYARVLSWDRRYPQSRRQYEIVMRELPDRPDVELEYAQTLSYNQNYVPAMRTFQSLSATDSPRAELYPDVPQRAHFHRGQIYRWYGWRDHAVEEQNAALALDGSYTDASRELERARLGRPTSRLEARYTTETNSNDFTMRRGDLEAEHWLNQRLAVQGSIGRHNFYQQAVSASANVASAGAAYRQTDQLTFRGRAGLTFWDEGLGTRPFLGVGAVWLPNIQSRAAIDFNHYDLIYDVSNLSSLALDPLSINDVRGHYDYDSGGFWSALADASYGLISDDNNRAAAHGLVSFRVLNSPFVAVKADGRWLSYDQRSTRYWSPNDYKSLAGVLQVGHNVDEKFFISGEIKYGRSWEQGRTSDLRAIGASVTVPLGDTFDLIGAYNYGRTGRFESIFGDSELTNYWQRSWYAGIRLKRLFSSDDRQARDRYYFDNRVLGSDVVPPEVR